jgi:hypothetical protein
MERKVIIEADLGKRDKILHVTWCILAIQDEANGALGSVQLDLIVILGKID